MSWDYDNAEDVKDQVDEGSVEIDEKPREEEAVKDGQPAAVQNPPSLLRQEEEMLKKKYGGLLPKKPPLISKDHERAFFDSADWALAKKNKGTTEALRPKLEPTPHHQAQSRRSSYIPTENEEDDGDTNSNSSEEKNPGSNGDNDNADASGDRNILKDET